MDALNIKHLEEAETIELLDEDVLIIQAKARPPKGVHWPTYTVKYYKYLCGVSVKLSIEIGDRLYCDKVLSSIELQELDRFFKAAENILADRNDKKLSNNVKEMYDLAERIFDTNKIPF